MPSHKFDTSKYKKIFESRYGAGSYDSGLSNARKIGTLKVQAEMAKKEYAARLKEAENAVKEAEKREQAARKGYKIYGNITAEESRKMQDKAQAQGRGGYFPTRDNQLKERKKTESAKVEYAKLTPYAREQMQKQAKKEEGKGLFGRFKDFITSKDVDDDGERDGLLGLVDRFVVPVSKGVTDFFVTGNTETMAENNKNKYGKVTNPVIKAAQKNRGTETKILNAIGTIGAAAVPYGQAYKAADVAFNKIPSLARIANPYAQRAIKGAAAGATAESGIAAVNELANPEAKNMRDYAIRAGIGAAGGAILDPAIYGIASIIKGARGARNAVSQADEVLGLPAPKQEPLGLPEPQLRLNGPRQVEPSLNNFNRAFRSPDGLNSPIPSMPKPLSQMMTQERLQQQGLNFGFNTKNTPKARFDRTPIETPIDPSNRGQQYWQQRYEDFAKRVNDNYDMNRMTPEALEDLWSQFAKYDEPVRLEQVVDLAYPKGFEAPSVPKTPAPDPPLKQALRDDPRVNELIKGFYPPARQEPKISRLDTLDEMVQRMDELAPPKAPEPSLEPLKFIRSVPANSLEQRFKEALNPKKKSFEAISPGKVDEEGTLIRAELAGLSQSPSDLKDIGGFKAATTDVYRNFRDFFGKDYEKVGKPVLDKLDSAKSEYVNMQKKWVKALDDNIVKKYGFRKGSKESALIQRYGEGEISLDELKVKSPQKWKDIVKADQWFRRSYDQLIDDVNASRKLIYPNNPDKMVPKRKDYYRHFREMNELSGLRNLFDTPSQIDPKLAGTSQYTTPKSKFAGFMQKRGNGPFKRDAVGGFLEYIPAASYSTKIDPVIPEFRNLKNALAESTGDSKNINNFIEYLDDYANDLAGKTNPIDRVPQKYIPGGRKTFNFISRLNSRVKANVILGNFSSALAQTANMPIAVAYGKQHAVKGASKTLESLFNKEAPIYQSAFLKERYSGSMYRKFDDKWFQQPRKMAEWMLETADKIGSSFIWNTTYQKGIKEGVKNPIKFADNETRKLVAGRGIGEVPLFQKARTTQIFIPFTLEVANQWRIMGDMVKGKDATGIMTLFLGNYLLNRVLEDTRGFGVSFDPINAVKDAVSDDDATNIQRGGRIAGEILSNTPGGQYLANLYPERGFGLPFTEKEMPGRKQLFGDRNPQRFGSGIVAMDGISDPFFKLFPPFGGNQMKKTIQGINAIKKEAVYNKDGTKLQYPVEANLENRLKSVLFGPSSFQESREYYGNERRPLSENQTLEYQQAKNTGGGNVYYENLQKQREISTLERKLKELSQDNKLTEKEKLNKGLELLKKIREVQGR